MKNYSEFLSNDNPRVLITMMDGGEMEIELFRSTAEETVDNFLSLVKENFYTSLLFHRVIKDFMIQGGDPTGTGMGGSEKKIKGEFRSNGYKNDLSHDRGVISMARTNNPNSASSQFFICHKAAYFLDGAYAAFGVVVRGLDVLDKIATTKTDSSDRPIEDQRIKEIKRIR